MDLLGNYGSSDEDEVAQSHHSKKIKVDLAPDVAVHDLSTSRYLTSHETKEISHNVPYADLSKPIQGPENPFRSQDNTHRNVLTGHFESHAMSGFDFDTLQRTYHRFGYTYDPSTHTAGLYGNIERASEQTFATINDKVKAKESKESKKARVTKADESKKDPSNIEGFLGPWAGYEGEQIHLEFPPDAEAENKDGAAGSAANEGESTEKAPSAGTERTLFHGKSVLDWQGRTYMHVPQDVDVDLNHEIGSQGECFLPKQLIHTWAGHTKGVNAIRFFPNSAHLLLSASMDSTVKIWDVFHDRKCLRTYMGHSKAVRDICFTNDGRKFLTASYDKWIKLWDTETGQCISRFTTKRIPYCVKFNPDEDKQNLFLAGCADKVIYQFDINTGDITQEYNQHLGAINTITFVDENRRFISTSDDKTLRAWEFDIPVVIKYVAEPSMHSMPAVAVHPQKKWLAFQSLDNQIVIYSARDKFRANHKKIFRGHLVAGYACQPSFSPDGRYVTSGDSEGKLWFWDWKSTKVMKKFKAHDAVVIGCEWHPHETSKVATCSWDGTIKYWD
ncbi:WD40-repeat-containing domain protein [Polychytrium aggregatum]|uniref:WD40-repeat-containing domain protein n=1 Tax=Polychytrium aggregatum TaxID=110093 RepID=UPI0022FF3929|nr:WD40-repeat-containing domain protein [Polychytrium aggregatum]KAI9206488.1 WD40-repeat-containing domain protein [Polychytrium aggregatum]